MRQTQERVSVRHQTTDGRFVQVGFDAWWDTNGVDIVGDVTINEYLDAHPRVGIYVERKVSAR